MLSDSWHDLTYNSDMIELNVSPQMQPGQALAQIASDRRRDKELIGDLKDEIAELRSQNQNLRIDNGRLRGLHK